MDEETVKPCIQDRLRTIAVRSKDIIEFFQIICLTIILLMFIVIPEILPIIYGREVIIPIFSQISLEGRFTIVISSSVILFSSAQYRSERKRNKIIDLRNELEKVYGPLFTLLQDYIEWVEAVGEPTMSLGQASILNEKFQTYPHIISTELYYHWKEAIITQNPRMEGRDYYMIDTQFVADILNEYEVKVNIYRKLVGKESHKRKQNKQRKTTMTYK